MKFSRNSLMLSISCRKSNCILRRSENSATIPDRLRYWRRREAGMGRDSSVFVMNVRMSMSASIAWSMFGWRIFTATTCPALGPLWSVALYTCPMQPLPRTVGALRDSFVDQSTPKVRARVACVYLRECGVVSSCSFSKVAQKSLPKRSGREPAHWKSLVTAAPEDSTDQTA